MLNICRCYVGICVCLDNRFCLGYVKNKFLTSSKRVFLLMSLSVRVFMSKMRLIRLRIL